MLHGDGMRVDVLCPRTTVHLSRVFGSPDSAVLPFRLPPPFACGQYFSEITQLSEAHSQVLKKATSFNNESVRVLLKPPQTQISSLSLKVLRYLQFKQRV